MRPGLTSKLGESHGLPAAARKHGESTREVLTLLDRHVEDIPYFNEPRAPVEAEGQADRHVHPAEAHSRRKSLRLEF